MFTTNNPQYNHILQCIFEYFSLQGNLYADIEILTETQMQRLNKETRNIDKPTDVLSYPFIYPFDFSKPLNQSNYPYEWDTHLQAVNIGNIAICESIAQKQALEYGHSFAREFSYLLLHGILHLMGFDHETVEDKKRMRETEEKILAIDDC